MPIIKAAPELELDVGRLRRERYAKLQFQMAVNGLDDPEKRARIAAVYNLFAAVTVPFLLYVLPRQMESLHPGAEGNPAFSEITHPIMRLVFYPAVIGFIGVFWLLYTQRVRTALLQERLDTLDTPDL